MNKKNVSVLMAALTLSGAFLGPQQMVRAMEAKSMESPTQVTANQSTDEYINYIKGLTCITEAEKAQILATEASVNGTWDKIEELEGKVHEVRQSVFKDFDKKYEGLYTKNEAIWAKFYADTKTDSSKPIIKQIKQCKSLTKKEKAILIKDQKKFDAYNKEFDALDKVFEQKSADLRKELDQLYKTVEAAYGKDSAINDKIQAAEAAANQGK